MQKKKLTDHLITFGQNIARIGFKSTIKYTLNGFNKKGNFTIKPKHYKYPITLRCNTSDFPTFEQVFSRQGYNIKGMPSNCDTIIDCGANIGLFSLYVKQKYPSAKIIVIEPESENFDLLVENTKFYDDIVCLHKGIWYKECFLKIVDELAEKWGFQVEESEQETNVQAISITDIIKKYNIEKIDILKIDIEGSEKHIFEKGSNAWLPYVKVLIIELHDNMVPFSSKALFRALEGYNFQTAIRGDNLIIFFDNHPL